MRQSKQTPEQTGQAVYKCTPNIDHTPEVSFSVGCLTKRSEEHQLQYSMANASKQGAAKPLLGSLYYTSVTHNMITDIIQVPSQGIFTQRANMYQQNPLTIS